MAPEPRMQLSKSVRQLPFAQIITTPSASDERGAEAATSVEAHSRRLVGILDAAVRGQAVAALWCRSNPRDPLAVFLAGASLTSGARQPSSPADSRKAEPLSFPLGATGSYAGEGEIGDLLESFDSWTPCCGKAEPLLDNGESPAQNLTRYRGLPIDDAAAYLATESFAWLIVCTPRDALTADEHLAELRRKMTTLRPTGDRVEDRRLEFEQIRARFRELSLAGTNGTWDVYVMVGRQPTQSGNAKSAEEDPDAVSALLCSAANHSIEGYGLRPATGMGVRSLNELLDHSYSASALDAFPFIATAELVAQLVRPPHIELPGIRAVAPPRFDTTPELLVRDPTSAVALGEVLDRNLRPAGALRVSLDTLSRHTFVCGATGSGKSQTVRALLEALSRRVKPRGPIPWLVIEPAKAEYASMAARLKDLPGSNVLVIRPGDRTAPPASLNPLEPASLEPGNPESTFPLQSHSDLVRALFIAAFDVKDPLPQILTRAITDCYGRSGWDLVTGQPIRAWNATNGQPGPSADAFPRYPGLGDLQRGARDAAGSFEYDEEARKRILGFLNTQIGSLRLGTPGRFFEGGHPLDVGALLLRNVVIDAQAITDTQDKAFFMGVLLIRIYEQLWLEENRRLEEESDKEQSNDESGAAPLRHILVIEEAHRLLRRVPDDSPIAHSLELFASLLAEIRAYGEGIVVVEQIPSKLISDVIKNTALKIVHRLPAKDDREAVGATMNLSEDQSQYVVTLKPGMAAVFADGMDRPLLATMPDVKARERKDKLHKPKTIPPFFHDRRRSRACGPECKGESPCSLQDMRDAQRLLLAHPLLTLWMELSCAVHVLGYEAPGFGDSIAATELRNIAAQDARRFHCAVAHACEDAIAARYEDLAQFFDPDTFGAHLASVAIARVGGDSGTSPCRDDSGRWRAGDLRFADLETWLAQLAAGETAPVSREVIEQRALERGLELGKSTVDRQLAYLKSLPVRRQARSQRLRLLVGRKSCLLAAASAVALPGDATQQVTEACKILAWPTARIRDTLLDQITQGLAAAGRNAGE